MLNPPLLPAPGVCSWFPDLNLLSMPSPSSAAHPKGDCGTLESPMEGRLSAMGVEGTASSSLPAQSVYEYDQ